MGLFRRLSGRPEPVKVMRLDLFMGYMPLWGCGSAAIEWVPLASSDLGFRPALVALLYARIVGAHAETREKLFDLASEIGKQNVRDQGKTGYHFPDWKLTPGFGAPPQTIWPWGFVGNRNALQDPAVYRATLLAITHPGSPDYFAIHLDMAFGQERILAPSSVLVAMTGFSEASDNEGRYALGALLWQMNEFYGSPAKVSVGQEGVALMAATQAIRSGRFRVP